MSKYSNEFKLKAIKYYKDGHSFESTAKHFNIPANITVQKWVRKYDTNGSQGLMKNMKSSYSGKFKQTVVEYMHTNNLSCLQTAIEFNLSGETVVSKWERIYYEEGPQGLYKERRGRSKNMSLKPKKKLSKDIEEDLIAENQRLRMENEYLKKLNALVQERIKRENKKK